MNTIKSLLPRVTQVQALNDFVLRVSFKYNSTKLFDVKPYLSYPAFQRLKAGCSFFKAHVEHGTVVWDEMLDISPDTLYLDGVTSKGTAFAL